MLLRKYLYIFKSTWQEYMAYRANFFLEILGGAALFGAIMFLWLNVYKSSGGAAIGGYTLPEMITYLLLGGALSAVTLSTSAGDEIDQEINEGIASNYFLKPIDVNFYWFSRDLARKTINLIFSAISFGIIFLAAREFVLSPASSAMLVLAFLAAGFGMAIHFLVFYLTSIISFWLGRTWGFRFVIRVVMEIATGAIIPLSFIPGVWQNILNFLPFKFLAYFPIQIYLGKFAIEQIASGFAECFVWLALLAVLSYYIWKKGVRHYTASGA